MMPRNGGRSPGRRTGATANIGSTADANPQHYQDSAAQSSPKPAMVVARAEAYPPAGRRSMWLLLIKSCPFCAYAHAHRGSLLGGPRESSCGRNYFVQPVLIDLRAMS